MSPIPGSEAGCTDYAEISILEAGREETTMPDSVRRCGSETTTPSQMTQLVLNICQ